MLPMTFRGIKMLHDLCDKAHQDRLVGSAICQSWCSAKLTAACYPAGSNARCFCCGPLGSTLGGSKLQEKDHRVTIVVILSGYAEQS